MIVDDRLETVLRTVAAGPSAIRTQFRQLVDLLGRTPAESWTSSHTAALDRIDSLGAALGDGPSGSLIRTAALRSPVLVDHFAAAGPRTALAAMLAARLRQADWLQLIPALPVQARGFLRHRRDLGPVVDALLARLGVTDFALPLPQGFEPLVVDAHPFAKQASATTQDPIPPAPASQTPAAQTGTDPTGTDQAGGIGAIIERIEAFRRAREGQAGEQSGRDEALTRAAEGAGQTRLPFADEPPRAEPRRLTALDLQLDADGTVIAADAAHAPAFVGLRPFAADPDAPASCDAATIRAARARQPIAAGLFVMESAGGSAATWQIDAAPLFAPQTGHFLGYHARLRRPAAAPPVVAANDDTHDARASGEADRLRQMLHELRTPINAIQGFSELIQQQALGPTPHQYRSLAAEIASDAARMLAGFEDIERLAQLEAGPESGQQAGEAELTGLLTRLIGQLEPVLAPREVHLRCDVQGDLQAGGPLMVKGQPAELERTLWRLLSLIASAAAPGEALAMTLAVHGGAARLTLPLPAALAMRDDAALMGPSPSSGPVSGLSGTGMLGSGFVLRLAAAEIRGLGGRFARAGAALDIALPHLTAAQQTFSQDRGPGGQTG